MRGLAIQKLGPGSDKCGTEVGPMAGDVLARFGEGAGLLTPKGAWRVKGPRGTPALDAGPRVGGLTDVPAASVHGQEAP